MKWLRLFFISGFVALLAGCATTPKAPVSLAEQQKNWQQYQIWAGNFTHWTLRGKLSLISPSKRGSLNLYWRQQGSDYHLILSDFLGRVQLTLDKQGNSFAVTDREGHHYQSSQPDELVTRLTGLRIPLAIMPQWIKGVPVALQRQTERNGEGLPGRFVTDNWAISYLEYRTILQHRLPSRLELVSPASHLTLKLAVYDWSDKDA